MSSAQVHPRVNTKAADVVTHTRKLVGTKRRNVTQKISSTEIYNAAKLNETCEKKNVKPDPSIKHVPKSLADELRSKNEFA